MYYTSVEVPPGIRTRVAVFELSFPDLAGSVAPRRVEVPVAPKKKRA